MGQCESERKKIGKETWKREKRQKDKVGQQQSRKYDFQWESKANDLVKTSKANFGEKIRDGFLESSWGFFKPI